MCAKFFDLKSALVLLIVFANFQNNKSYELNDPPPLCSAYEMSIVNTKQCVSRCPLICMDGTCFEDGVCPCEKSYLTSFDLGLICAQSCLTGCVEAGGFCASPDVCICSHKTHTFDPVSRKCRKHSHFKDKCRGRCIYGHCNPDGTCICSEGFRLTDGLFGQLCIPECKQDCGRHGFCFLPNMCACRKKHEHYGADGLCHHEDEDYIF